MGLFDTPLFKNVAAACKNSLSRLPSPAGNALRAPRADPSMSSAEPARTSEQQQQQQQPAVPPPPSPPGSFHSGGEFARAFMHTPVTPHVRHTPRSRAVLDAAIAGDEQPDVYARTAPVSRMHERAHERPHVHAHEPTRTPASPAPARSALNRALARVHFQSEPEILPADSDDGDEQMGDAQSGAEAQVRKLMKLLEKERAEKEQERFEKQQARADVSNLHLRNNELENTAGELERKKNTQANVRTGLSNAGRMTSERERVLYNLAEDIGWHVNADGTPGMGRPGDHEMRVSPDECNAARAQAVPVSPAVPAFGMPASPAPSSAHAGSVRADTVDEDEQFDSALRTIETYMPHPANAKVTVPPVRKWSVRDNAWRDVNTFLKDCCAYAAAARQEILAVVTTSMDENMRLGYESVLQAVVREEQSVWHACVRAFLIVTGRDIRNPQAEAYRKLDRGQIKQAKGESVLDFGNRIRILHMQSGSRMPALSVCDRFIDGLWSRDLRHAVCSAKNGGRWTNLHECVNFAVSEAEAYERTRAPPRPALSAVSKFGNSSGVKRSRPQSSNFIPGGKRFRPGSASPPARPPPPPRSGPPPARKQSSPGKPRNVPPPPDAWIVPFPGECNTCGRVGHKASSHTAPEARREQAASIAPNSEGMQE